MTKVCISENNFNKLFSLSLKKCGNSNNSGITKKNTKLIFISEDGKCIPGQYKNPQGYCRICPLPDYINNYSYNCYDGQNMTVIDGLDPDFYPLFGDREGVICQPGFKCSNGDHDPVHCPKDFYCPGAYHNFKTNSIIGSPDPIKCPDGTGTLMDRQSSIESCVAKQ